MASVLAIAVSFCFAVAMLTVNVVKADSPPQAPARPEPRSAKVASDYEALMGNEERRVVASGNGKAYARLAGSLAEKAQALLDEPELVNLLCEKAYEFGLKDPEGYPAALYGVKHFLAQGSSPQWRAKAVVLYRLQLKSSVGAERSAAGEALISALLDDANGLMAAEKATDALKIYREAASIASVVRSPRSEDITQLIADAQAAQQTLERIARLQEQLSQDPDKLSVRNQIINLYVALLDDPAGAVPYSASHPDRTVRRLVPLATKDAKDLAEPELLDMARFYKGLSDKLDGTGKATTLGHAVDYYEAFLARHEAKDAPRLIAQDEMNAAVKVLATLGPSHASRIVIWNQHNGTLNDCGTSTVNVILLSQAQPVWKAEGLNVPWEANQDTFLTVRPPKIPFDTVRVEITKIRGTMRGVVRNPGVPRTKKTAP